MLLHELNLSQSYQELPSVFYSVVQPTPLDSPYLIHANQAVARLLGLSAEALTQDQLAPYLGGQQTLPGIPPIAQIYSGHQFGGYTPQLGDGRGILLAEVEAESGHWDLHLKGAGPTPYSRAGDGRAVLRSTIREYLCSEAMAGLGIGTTRALALATSNTPVARESMESGATLLRVAPSHVRFGHFEYFHYTDQHAMVQQLADYIIDQHFHHFADEKEKYRLFFQEVVERTAVLIAQWHAAGFAHGVMNTDNMSILGITIDYGPFGFIDDYNPGFICNHSDHQGRYAFNQQPGIGLWNLNALAHALSSLLDSDTLSSILQGYQPILQDTFLRLMQTRLGLSPGESSNGQPTATNVAEQQPQGNQDTREDHTLIHSWLDLLARQGSDYTTSMRALADITEDNVPEDLSWLTQQSCGADWLNRYRQRIATDKAQADERRQSMLATNPKYVLRNYLAQTAIEQAEQGEFAMIGQLMQVLASPFEEHYEYEDWAAPAPNWGKGLAVSCSS